jgi:phenylalanyl-tRNA synthetase alpha chain
MSYQNKKIAGVAEKLKAELKGTDEPQSVLRSPLLKGLYAEIPTLNPKERSAFGKEINALKAELEVLIEDSQSVSSTLEPIDVTAPFDVNVSADSQPGLLAAADASVHPLMRELDKVVDIFQKMGFAPVESRQIDDIYHMFDSLNFPEGHPARDDYDTFMTEEGFVAPAHVSTMQNRVLKAGTAQLEAGKPITNVYVGRAFRNEDVDARHEHTFYQVELMYVGKDINVGNLVATFRTFLSEYYEKDIEVKSQPFYFPFTEPSFELAISCPFCDKAGCKVCGEGWIELLGMGMVNPNVLKMAGIDPSIYTGFAGGLGLDRLVMMKYDIDDVRHFHSGNLAFLGQFK